MLKITIDKEKSIVKSILKWIVETIKNKITYKDYVTCSKSNPYLLCHKKKKKINK